MHGTSNYTQELDVVRFKVKAEKSARYYENFTIEVSDIIQNNAVLYLIWENTQVRVNITTNTDEKIVAEIQQKMQSSKNDASLLFQAAKYYYDSNKDLKEPLVWMTQAVGITTDNFYYFHQKALIEAKMGDYKTAILSAKKSLEVAKTNKLTEWVKRNENLIAEWEKLKK
jgi:tetratricopeptide (TPR) repeat protein